MATPIPSQGTVITHNANTVGGHKSFSGLAGGQASEEDVTTLASTAKEKRLGLVDEGSFTIDCIYDGSDVGQASMIAARTTGLVKTMVITLSDGTVATFSCLIQAAPVDAAVDVSLTTVYTVVISGTIAWS